MIAYIFIWYMYICDNRTTEMSDKSLRIKCWHNDFQTVAILLHYRCKKTFKRSSEEMSIYFIQIKTHLYSNKSVLVDVFFRDNIKLELIKLKFWLNLNVKYKCFSLRTMHKVEKIRVIISKMFGIGSYVYLHFLIFSNINDKGI